MSIGAVVSSHSCFSHSTIHISSLNVFFLSSYSPPGFFLFFMNFSNHGLDSHSSSFSFILRIVSLHFFSFEDHLFFLLEILIGNDSFFDSLILECHLLDVFTNLVNSSSQALVHLFVA